MNAQRRTRRAKLGAREFKRTVLRGVAAALSVLAAAAAFAPTAAAQCAMCYQSAAASGNRSRVALQHGILILLIPSVGLFVGIFGLIYSRRNVSR